MLLCKVKLVGSCIKRREVVVGDRRIRSEKLSEGYYREGYAQSLKGKGVEEGDNVKHMWEQVKQAMVESTRKICGLMRVGGKNPKNVWWNDEVKAAVRGNEAAWKEKLAASDEESKERCIEAYRRKERV